MKKIVILSIILFIIFSPHKVNAEKLHIPPIPQESSQSEKVAIVTFTDHETGDEIFASFPSIKIRHRFKYALNGASIQGTLADLTKLAKSNKVKFLSFVQTYEGRQENIRIIEGDKVRGRFDDKKHRLTGEGITVGVIDTGIDYDHPDLERNYSGGADVVDGDDDPMETKEEHPHYNTFHGTHVAGIIGANGKMLGVAPGAKIVAYRALGPGGMGTTEQILLAIDQAIEDKVDILNLSLGNDINGPDLPINIALNNAAERGIVPVTSAGNSGPNTWTVGSPGTASKAISVGASTPPMEIPLLSINGGREKFRLHPVQGDKRWDMNRSYLIRFAGLGKKKEVKKTAGSIALIERGGMTLVEKVKNAKKAGAVGVIIYNNTDGEFFGYIEEDLDIPVSFMNKKEGEQLRKQVETADVFGRIEKVEEKDRLAPFSSRGPVTASWEIKPDVVAPGVSIVSTVPGGYLPLQGTSMAAPHVAGACALIKQAHPHWSVEEIKASLMNTALPLLNEQGKLYRTFEQGAGRIQVEKAIQTESIVIPSSLNFGKFKTNETHHIHSQTLTVKNVGKKPLTYSFSIPKKEEGIQWDLPLSFTLEPNEAKEIEIKMSVNRKEQKNKIFDGYLLLHGGTQTIHIPYLYVMEEPDYPRVMGFDFGLGDEEGTYRYEVYLPGGADEFGIALFDPDSYQFIGFLDTLQNVGRGLLKRELDRNKIRREGIFMAVVFAKKAGKEDTIETMIPLIDSDSA